MSFTSRYGSSVSRDYTLLQGHPASYQHFGALNARLAREEEAAVDENDEQATHASSFHDDLSLTSGADDVDGVSNISLPHRHLPIPGSPSFARTNHLISAGAAGAIFGSEGVNGHRRASANAVSQVAGIPSEYLLGGPAFPPPISASYRDILDELHYEDDDGIPTPMPHHYKQRDYLNHHGARTGANETTSLLSRRPGGESGISAYGAAGVLNADGAAGTSGFSVGGKRRPSVSAASIISGGHGVSGWAAANHMNEVPVPGVEQVEAIALEPRNNIAWREAKMITRYTIPIWLTHVLELSLSVASVFSLGHLGTLELAAASLSSMTANVSGYSVVSGFISALDTILPSAYTQNPKTVGLWTQRMAVILVGLMPLILAVWFNAERILVGMGQDPEVAKLAGTYLAILSIGLPGYAAFETCRRYLQAQGLMHAPTLVLLVVSPLNAVANYLLVWGPEPIRLGFIGAPLASSVSMWVMAVLCFLQCVLAPRTAWDGWTRAAFKWQGIKPVLSLGFAGMLSLAAEWWAWEIVGLVTSILGTTALAAQSVLLVSSSVTYQLPFGASVAAAVRVGNLLGANRPREAKISSNVSLFISLVLGAVNSSVYIIFRKQWGYMFSSDIEVIKLVEQILPLLALFQVADGVCGIAGGVLRGTGRQAQGALINMTAYYLVGIPIGLVLTFSKLKMGLEGLWWGLTIALMYGSVGIVWLIARTDWEWEVKKVQLRMTLDDPHEAIIPDSTIAKDDSEAVSGAQTAAVVENLSRRRPNHGQGAIVGSRSSVASSVIEESEDEDEDEA